PKRSIGRQTPRRTQDEHPWIDQAQPSLLPRESKHHASLKIRRLLMFRRIPMTIRSWDRFVETVRGPVAFLRRYVGEPSRFRTGVSFLDGTSPRFIGNPRAKGGPRLCSKARARRSAPRKTPAPFPKFSRRERPMKNNPPFLVASTLSLLFAT